MSGDQRTCCVCGRPISPGSPTRHDPANRSQVAHKICGRRAAWARKQGDSNK